MRHAIATAIGLDCELEHLHTALPGFSPAKEQHKAVMAAKQALLRPLAAEAGFAGLLAEYDAMICRVVAPALDESFGGEMHRLHYACLPTLRVQTPSEELATIRVHCDGMYGLQAGSVNYWLPLTAVAPTSGLWVEGDTATGEDGAESGGPEPSRKTARAEAVCMSERRPLTVLTEYLRWLCSKSVEMCPTAATEASGLA